MYDKGDGSSETEREGGNTSPREVGSFESGSKWNVLRGNEEPDPTHDGDVGPN